MDVYSSLSLAWLVGEIFSGAACHRGCDEMMGLS